MSQDLEMAIALFFEASDALNRRMILLGTFDMGNVMRVAEAWALVLKLADAEGVEITSDENGIRVDGCRFEHALGVL